jgi:signal transduction histidine kinase
MMEESQSPDLSKKLASVMDLTNSTIELVRQVASELRPGLLDDLGLDAALEWHAKEFSERTHIQCELHGLAELGELRRDISTALYRIFQESLTNVARHAGASCVSASLRGEPGMLVLTVTDNGCGIMQEDMSNRRSMGLLGMRERARALGGDVMIRGQPGKGTTVEAHIPMGMDYQPLDKSF